MSLLGKQVYANPTTPIWGQGGNVGPNPTFNSVTFIAQGPPFVSTGIETTELDSLGSAVSIVDVSGNLGPLAASSFYAEPPVGFGARVAYKNDRIDFENASQVAYSLATVNNTSNGWNLSNISTINGSNYPPSGGSYPRDASFNSVTVNPTGGPNPIGFGLGGTATIGIRQLDEDGNPAADYITFSPSSSQMDLSNVNSINARPIPLTVTNFAQSNIYVPLPAGSPGVTLLGLTFTAPTDGKLFIQGNGTFQSTVTTRTQVGFLFDVNGSTLSNSFVIAACAANAQFTETVVPTMTQFSVTGGTVYDISAIAYVAGGSANDWNATNVQLYSSFTTS